MTEHFPPDSQGKIVVFGAKLIRRAWLDDQCFSIVDIIAALTDSPNPRDYWYRMKRRGEQASGIQLSTLCRQLKLTASDGKSYATEVVNSGGGFGRQEFAEMTEPWDAMDTRRTIMDNMVLAKEVAGSGI